MAERFIPLIGITPSISTEDDIITIPEARYRVKDKFAKYHNLLDDRESELLAELELLEETNKPELDHVRSDLVKLRGVVDSFGGSLRTSTLRTFLDEQKSVWKDQILSFDRSIELLSHVKLNFSDIEISIKNAIKVVPFWSKAKFRTELESVLQLKPNLEEDWYVVSNVWFSEFTNSINLTNPQQNDSWEFPVKIPIQTKDTPVQYLGDYNPKLLHFKAWDMLLSFNGLSPGSIPIKRQSYLNETTNEIEVPIQPTKQKCIIGHYDGNFKFSFECEIGTFPYETSENILKKLSGFSTLFTDYPPIIYTLDNTNTVTYDANYICYTVSNVQTPSVHYPGFAPVLYGQQPLLGLGLPTGNANRLIPNAKVSVKDKRFLVLIPGSLGNNPFQVISQ